MLAQLSHWSLRLMMKIVLIEDDKTLNRLIVRSLNKYFNIKGFFDLKSAFDYINSVNTDVIISDIRLPDGNGINLLKKIKTVKPEIYFILITGYGTIEEAVTCIKSGAHDYILKPVDPELLKAKLEIIEENIYLKLLTKASEDFKLIHESVKMAEIINLALKVANTDSNVLISGETGTGKSVLGRFIHINSSRKNNPFIHVNCANLQETLFESELFGYKKGAFTGADSNKKGLVKLADKGTLLLDEVGEIPIAFQSKLLRFIEEKKFLPLGATSFESSDVRIIAATNKDLHKMVKNNEFRDDLYYRLNIINIDVPPLRERREDIIPLSYLFLEKFKDINRKITDINKEAKSILMNYDFPGNVRELSNIIERAMILESSSEITPSSIALCSSESPENSLNLDNIIKKHILHVIDLTEGDKSKAAQLLDIDRSTLYRKLKEYGFS